MIQLHSLMISMTYPTYASKLSYNEDRLDWNKHDLASSGWHCIWTRDVYQVLIKYVHAASAFYECLIFMQQEEISGATGSALFTHYKCGFTNHRIVLKKTPLKILPHFTFTNIVKTVETIEKS